MKAKLYTVICLLLILTSCKKDTDYFRSTQGITYRESFNNWQAFKQRVNNNYTYTVTTGSWVGTSSVTKLTITNGVVTGRDFKSYAQIPGTGSSTVTKTWSETAATLNTHDPYAGGAATLTMDEVYAKAKTEWLNVDTDKNTIYFETNNNGMISSCGYVPNNCADDCFRGITIKEIVGL